MPHEENGLPSSLSVPVIGNPNRPGVLEMIINWPEGENFGLTDEEEQEQVTGAEEAPPYNQLPAEETRYALFTYCSCHIPREALPLPSRYLSFKPRHHLFRLRIRPF
ncbi:hypothetical protein DUI87_24412 [Hirundo rustica rustica]|uniref:Uncharacterized protein n=1 Tax=Hirundo rustica rustica TaxID=333673 RepID=A0A3M0JDD1_HIRRU|nr:hypothetical protein DUI87_24412 [Hirundo rustica rustica]